MTGFIRRRWPDLLLAKLTAAAVLAAVIDQEWAALRQTHRVEARAWLVVARDLQGIAAARAYVIFVQADPRGRPGQRSLYEARHARRRAPFRHPTERMMAG